MFHFIEKPRPPANTGRDTLGHEVDSSAMVRVSGKSRPTATFSCFRNSIASRFSLPP
jgi:hypothetical protein